jgi:hypothetical protein
VNLYADGLDGATQPCFCRTTGQWEQTGEGWIVNDGMDRRALCGREILYSFLGVPSRSHGRSNTSVPDVFPVASAEQLNQFDTPLGMLMIQAADRRAGFRGTGL